MICRLGMRIIQFQVRMLISDLLGHFFRKICVATTRTLIVRASKPNQIIARLVDILRQLLSRNHVCEMFQK